MFGRESRSVPDVFLVLLGAGRSQDSLRLAVVTGSEKEAWDLLTIGRRWFPDRSNEVAQWAFETESGRSSSRRASIGPGEKRPVFVLEFEDGRYEVFDTKVLALRRQQETQSKAAKYRARATLLEVVSNTWAGEFSVADDSST